MSTSGMTDERLARDRSGADHDIEHTLGDTRSRASSASIIDGERGDLRRFEHDRVAGRDSRQHLPHRHLQRVVPGRDRADDAHRFAADHRGVIGVVLRRSQAVQDTRRAGEEDHIVDRTGNIELGGHAQCLACLPRLHHGVLIGARTRTRSANARRRIPRAPTEAGETSQRKQPAPGAPRRRHPAGPARSTVARFVPTAGSMMSSVSICLSHRIVGRHLRSHRVAHLSCRGSP